MVTNKHKQISALNLLNGKIRSESIFYISSYFFLHGKLDSPSVYINAGPLYAHVLHYTLILFTGGSHFLNALLPDVLTNNF